MPSKAASSDLLLREVPHRADGGQDLAGRLAGALRAVIASRSTELKISGDLEKVLFVISHLIDALSHAAALSRPRRLSLAAAKAETVQAIMAYLRAR
jgi:hypothetical protein